MSMGNGGATFPDGGGSFDYGRSSSIDLGLNPRSNSIDLGLNPRSNSIDLGIGGLDDDLNGDPRYVYAFMLLCFYAVCVCVLVWVYVCVFVCMCACLFVCL